LVIPVMRRQGAGRIINVSSVAGKIARPYSSVYDSTKHALEAISDGLRGELAPFGIQVVLIEPGLIITEFMDVADQVSLPHLRESGPYASILEESRKNQHRGRSIAAPADVIANLILKGLSDSRPRLRYVAPLHAKIFLALKWFLPGRTFDFLLNRILNPTPPKPSL
jgi:short-subunit dehydrogenase